MTMAGRLAWTVSVVSCSAHRGSDRAARDASPPPRDASVDGRFDAARPVLDGSPDAAADAGEPAENPLSGDWPTLGGGPLHEGHLPVRLGDARFTPSWSLPDFGPFWLSAAGDKVVATAVTTAGKLVRTLDAATGEDLWIAPFPSRAAFPSQPTIDGTTVYAWVPSNFDGSALYAWDLATGVQRWSHPFMPSGEGWLTTCVAGGRVYVPATYGLAASDGSELFFAYDTTLTYDWAPACDGDAVYTLPGDGSLRARDGASGDLRWQVALPTSSFWMLHATPVIADGVAYVAQPPSLAAVDLASHAVRWLADGAYRDYPAVAAGIVYAVADGTLHAIDATTGVETWRFVGDAMLAGSPIATDDHVIVASPSRSYAVSLASHASAWEGPGARALALASTGLYLAGTEAPDGTLYRFVLSP